MNVTIRKAIADRRIIGLFCAHHDKHSMAGQNLTEEYLDRHDRLCIMRVDATGESCAVCENPHEALYLTKADLLLCKNCLTATESEFAPIGAKAE